MSNYYQYINGQRYDASLIRNAERRTKGRGDGRISKEDAQELWQIAMDGGRITDTEKQTIDYLMENQKWTDAAKEWIEKALNSEIEKITSYYKVIEGLKYDRRILEKAGELAKGNNDNHISEKDATFLWTLFGDYGDVTIEEERTFYYLFDQYKWTDNAKQYFCDRFDAISKESNVASQIHAIFKHDFEFSGLEFEFLQSDLKLQTLGLPNQVNFPEAFWQALDCLLHFESEDSLAGNLARWHRIDSDTEERSSVIENLVREYIAGGRLVLLPGTMDSEPSLTTFPTPWKKETLEKNWLFGLELFDITDDIYWVIVSRDGKQPAYNYVGGPNYEEYWPRV